MLELAASKAADFSAFDHPGVVYEVPDLQAFQQGQSGLAHSG